MSLVLPEYCRPGGVLTLPPTLVFISTFFATSSTLQRPFCGRAYSITNDRELSFIPADRGALGSGEIVRGRRGFHDYFTSHLPGSSVFPDGVPPRYVHF